VTLRCKHENKLYATTAKKSINRGGHFLTETAKKIISKNLLTETVIIKMAA